jgi:hypothetical protein
MNKWEYKCLHAVVSKDKANETVAWLNKLGEEGWELVAICPSSNFSQMFFLKKPK